MKELDIKYKSSDGKEITAFITEPDKINSKTGMMLVVHGHGNNRFQYKDMMVDFCNRYNVICASPEYRDCGYDVSDTGIGFKKPYDYNHKQVMDSLNLVKVVLSSYKVNKQRLIAWGGSQGGHNVLMCTVFAPNTFVLTIDCCGPYMPHGEMKESVGRNLDGHELAIRNVLNFIDRISNKIYIFHGDNDDIVEVGHSYKLVEALKKAGKDYFAFFVKGGDHFLAPANSRADITINCCTNDIMNIRKKGKNDFDEKTKNEYLGDGVKYIVDFSRETIDIYTV